ncbi:arginase family protein [Pseudomonas fluorescens]|uniref:Arginase family protein n=1 Tax=Pseudomonas fluorescens TaxID=294 RepID=A0A327N822_PSEFL|nr:arginase family protein [Pseudomonas fluorescens]RAI70873.1 arginase family protein [Pseudomonas fluorescens]
MTSRKPPLRLVFPQWQGGAREQYGIGAELLNWLAPKATGPVVRLEIPTPDAASLKEERGIMGRAQLLKQTDDARAVIEQHAPDRLIVLGGDCLVDLAPFAYLSEKYGDDFAILWVDAHPDILTPNEFNNAHAMVLGNLLGEGDEEFRSRVKVPVKPENVMYAGLEDPTEFERGFIDRLGLRSASGDDLRDSSQPIIDWLRSIKAKHVAVHFDLDVLSPSSFGSILFNNPDAPEGTYDGIARGKMTIPQVVRLLKDVSAETEVVAIGITEHFPWDAIALKKMMAELPLIG